MRTHPTYGQSKSTLGHTQGPLVRFLLYVKVSIALDPGSGLPPLGSSLIPQSLHDMP